MTEKKNYFEILKQIRTTTGMPVSELAKKSGVSEPTIRLLESGETKKIDFYKVLAITTALNCDIVFAVKEMQRRKGKTRGVPFKTVKK